MHEAGRIREALNALLQIAAVVVALGLTTIVLVISKAPPTQAYVNIALGAVGS